MERISNSQIFKVYEEVMGQRISHQDKQAVVDFAVAVLKADRERDRKLKAMRALGSSNHLSVQVEMQQIKEFESAFRIAKCKRCGLTNGCSVGCGDE